MKTAESSGSEATSRAAGAGSAPSSGLAVLAILATLAGWTVVPLFLKHFVSLIDAWTANGWRYGASALLWLPVLLLSWKRGTLPPGLWRTALVPSVFNALAQALFGLAPYYIEPGLMVFSLRIQIVFVALGAVLMFASERRVIRQPMFLAGLAMVLGGTLATLAFKPGGIGGGTATGVAMAMGSGVLYAAYALAVRRTMTGMNPLVAFAAVSQYTAVALVVPMFFFARDAGLQVLELPSKQFFLLMLSAIIGIGLGHTFYFFSMARLGVAVASGVVQLQPVTVGIASFFIFGERLTALQWGTGVVAIAGAALILISQHRTRKLVERERREAAPTSEPADPRAQPETFVCAACGYELSDVGGPEAPVESGPQACPGCGEVTPRWASASNANSRKSPELRA